VSLSLFSTIFLNGSSPVSVDTRRLALEASSADWFRWVTWYGYAVAVGCAMEVWEVSITIKNWWLFSFRKIEIAEDKGSWASPIAAVGLILIVAGIVLETYCEGKVADAETELRNHFSETLTAAENEAASATRDAGTAKQSALIAARASGEASLSSKKAEDSSIRAIAAGENATTVASGARKEAESFDERIVSANKTATEAESHLAAALERTARLEAQLSWRTVTPEQSATIAAYLKPSFFNPNMNFRGLKISLEYNQGDLEASEYAEDLGKALRVALNGFGVEIGEPKGMIVMRSTGPPITGLILQVNRADDGRAVVLQRALGAAGIVAVEEPKSEPEGTFSLFVGVRPRPSAAKQ